MEQKSSNIHHGGCDDAEVKSGKRNRFFLGKQMKAEEFTLEQAYGIERRRLLNRSVLGWGVVHGFQLSLRHSRQDEVADASAQTAKPPGHVPPGVLCIGSGLALDQHGYEISPEGAVELNDHNCFVVVKGEDCKHDIQPIESMELGKAYVLSVHYAERRGGDAYIPSHCGCEHHEKNYVCETAVYSLTPIDPKRGCRCAENDCNAKQVCGYAAGPCDFWRGPHTQLCHWTMDRTVPELPPQLCEWHGQWVSIAAPVPLACVTVVRIEDRCVPLAVIDDACGPRRIVKNNDLLFDLVRGCDLTRISSISWSAWHRAETAISWHEFAKKFQANGCTDFVVRFSGPVLRSSLRTDIVTMTMFTVEQPTGWIVARRVPIIKLDLEPLLEKNQTLAADLTNGFRLHVNPRWLRDELAADEESWLSEREFVVEIEIRGDLILDCRHQAVDANVRIDPPIPSGNGTPGGTFVSSFHVQRKPLGTLVSKDEQPST